ncbi:MAG: NAD-dependent epimerase/dehydratase family protein [Thiohalocapsa sp.]
MRYLVTGANGFLGRALGQELVARGFQVVAALRSPNAGPWNERVFCVLGDAPLPPGLCDGVDGVFHLAGIAHVQAVAGIPDAVYERVNVGGTRALLDAAIGAGVSRFVYFSSVKAAADPREDCVDEQWGSSPTDAYGRSTLTAERLVLSAAASGALDACILRPTLVYGRGVKGNLQRMLEAVESGRFPPIPEFGNRRSMVSVGDLVAAAILAMGHPAASGRTYIVADGVDYSTRDLYLAISEALGRTVPTWAIPALALRAGGRVGDLLERVLGRPMPISSAVMSRLAGSACYRSTRLRAELGWAPTESFFDNIDGMVSEMSFSRPRSVRR